MGLFTGWHKLIDFTITFGDGNNVAVSTRSHTATVAGFEYIRLWLQYVAQVIYLLVQLGPQYSEPLEESLARVGNENITSGTDIFDVLGINENMNYAGEIQNTRSTIKGKYYVKGSMYRMVDAGIAEPEVMIYSVLALLQYVHR